MTGLNNVVMVGRLTDDPNIKTINGTPKARFSIAVNRQYRDRDGNSREETTYVPIVVWGKQAEICAEYLAKGRTVAVNGRLRIDNFEADDGQSRKVVEIIARNVQFIDAPTKTEPEMGGRRQDPVKPAKERTETPQETDMDSDLQSEPPDADVPPASNKDIRDG